MLPPGPRWPSIRKVVELMRHPYAPFWEAARRYGPVFTMRLMGQPTWVSIGEPALVERVFRAGSDELHGATDVMRMLLPEGALVLQEAEAHRNMRRKLAPFFQPEPMTRHAETMRRAIDEAIDRLVPGERVCLADFYAGVTLRTIVECLFGVTRAARREELEHTMALDLRRLARPDFVLATLLFSGARVGRFLAWAEQRAREAGERSAIPLANRKAKLRRIIGEEITAVRGSLHAARGDLLAQLVEARNEEGEALTDDMIYAQLRSILLGAHETSAFTLSWATYFVLRDRAAAARLGVEVGGGAPPDEAALDAVLKEAMRIRPIAHHTARMAARTIPLGPYTIPAGVFLLPSQAVVHFREDLWERPHDFLPQRFLGASPPSPYRYFPFGGGSRACLGRVFALLQMRILFARVLERVTLRLAPEADPRPVMRGLLVGPSDGVPVMVERVR